MNNYYDEDWYKDMKRIQAWILGLGFPIALLVAMLINTFLL